MSNEVPTPSYQPGFAVRFLSRIARLIVRIFYRIRVIGQDHIPATGGALFVCNHVSWVDALLVGTASRRHVRFMMFKDTYELWCVKPWSKIMGVIPISSEQKPREMIKSLQAASDAIKSGDIVCIFAEGQITRIGNLLPFRRGYERIMKDLEAPIVPVALDGLWGSIFSFEKKRFLWKLPRSFPYPVTVSFGAPMPGQSTPGEVRHAVQELIAEAWPHRRERMKTLSRALISTARRSPRRFAMVDPQTPAVTFGGVLVRSILLARRLRQVWAGQEMVGLLLPPSVGGALANYAALLLGKVPVNLNYTVSEQTLLSCAQQCGIKTVLTSRAFLEKVKLTVPGQVIYLEDIVGKGAPSKVSAPGNADELNSGASPTPSLSPSDGERVAAGRFRGEPPSAWEKFSAFLAAFFLPAATLERSLRDGNETNLDSLATVIFSSGSTGDPKGVMLSHYNIASNLEQMDQVFGFTKTDRVLGILPFFHSFGFTGALVMPIMFGAGVAYHANPLDARTIGPLVRDYRLTFLLTTPTFLQLYMRGCTPDQFGSLRVVMTGAEKLPDRLALAFEEQFGIRALEGYGCTECSPAVTVNAPDFRAAGFHQVGGKRGKIGHPLPGMSVRIVDVATGQPVPDGQSGVLLVRGPNVMQGYLGKPEKTAEVLLRDPSPGLLPASSQAMRRAPGEGPWYVTGDVAAQDEDGFLQITDRLSRFSKIGGEMVPHIKVEEKLHEVAAVTEQTFVVTSAPDEKKGERLVVLHKLPDDKLPPVLEKFGASDLPNLWKPKADSFFRVEGFPLLGTGKLDLRKVKEVAGQLVATTDGQ